MSKIAIFDFDNYLTVGKKKPEKLIIKNIPKFSPKTHKTHVIGNKIGVGEDRCKLAEV